MDYSKWGICDMMALARVVLRGFAFAVMLGRLWVVWLLTSEHVHVVMTEIWYSSSNA